MTPEQIEIPPTELDRIRTDAIKWEREEWRRMNKNITDIYIDAAKAEYLHRLSTTPSDTGARWDREAARAVGKEAYKSFAGLPSEFDTWFDATYPPESAPAPLQDKGIREAIETRLMEVAAIIVAEKTQRADLPRGSAYHKACTESIEEHRIRYDELNKLTALWPSSPLPLSDKK